MPAAVDPIGRAQERVQALESELESLRDQQKTKPREVKRLQKQHDELVKKSYDAKTSINEASTARFKNLGIIKKMNMAKDRVAKLPDEINATEAKLILARESLRDRKAGHVALMKKRAEVCRPHSPMCVPAC